MAYQFSRMPRLIVFGCSFTYQNYPTWADILSLSFDSYENYARGGAGHRYILTALQQRLMRGDITPDDTIIVQWSSSYRFDAYKEGKWTCRGGVHFNDDISKFAELCWDIPSAMLETLTCIISAINMLEQHGAKWYMCQLDGLDQDQRFKELSGHDDLISNARRYIDTYKDRWATSPMHDFCLSTDLAYKQWLEPDGSLFLDMHPTPYMGYRWMLECLMPTVPLLPLARTVESFQRRFDRCITRSDIAKEFGDHDWHCSDYIRDERYLDAA